MKIRIEKRNANAITAAIRKARKGSGNVIFGAEIVNLPRRVSAWLKRQRHTGDATVYYSPYTTRKYATCVYLERKGKHWYYTNAAVIPNNKNRVGITIDKRTFNPTKKAA